MPLFDYDCEKCKTVEERFVKDYRDPQRCEECGAKLQKRMPLVNSLGLFKTNIPYNPGLGFKPNSTKEIDQFCKKNGIEPV